jgi:hypothetical protein
MASSFSGNGQFFLFICSPYQAYSKHLREKKPGENAPVRLAVPKGYRPVSFSREPP